MAIAPQIVSPLAGIAEIILGLVIIFYKKNLIPIYAGAFSLIALLAYVAFADSTLLVEAFNPVTTNISALALCYFIIRIDRHLNQHS